MQSMHHQEFLKHLMNWKFPTNIGITRAVKSNNQKIICSLTQVFSILMVMFEITGENINVKN